MGVRNVEQTAAYYTDFGLILRTYEEVSTFSVATPAPTGDRTFATVDGGAQLRIVHSHRRRLLELGIGADDPDYLDRVAGSAVFMQRPGVKAGVVRQLNKGESLPRTTA